MPTWEARLQRIIQKDGIDAGIAYLESAKAQYIDDEHVRMLDTLVQLRSATFWSDSPPGQKIERLEKLRADVQELVNETFLVQQSAYRCLLEAALLAGPSVMLDEIAAPAFRLAKSLIGTPSPSDSILREIRNNFLHRVSLAACAIGDVNLAKDAYSAMDEKHWVRDKHLIRLLEPFGVQLPPGIQI